MNSLETTGPILLANFPAAYHEKYAKNSKYLEENSSLLPSQPSTPLSFLSTLSAQSISHLEELPFFDCKTLSWSLFDRPKLELSNHPFSSRYFSWVQESKKKFQNFVKNKEKKDFFSNARACEALTSLFTLHDTLFEMVHFINMRRTVQKA